MNRIYSHQEEMNKIANEHIKYLDECQKWIEEQDALIESEKES